MPLGGGVDRWADINPIDIDPLKAPSIFGRPLQKSIDHFRVMNVGGRNDNGEDEAERTGQDVPFHALDLFIPVESPATFLRSRYNTLRVHDPGRRLTRMALSLAHGPGQVAGHFRPNSIGAKPVVPPSHRFPGAKILREIRPGATSPLQIETGIDHFPQIHRQSVYPEKITLIASHSASVRSLG